MMLILQLLAFAAFGVVVLWLIALAVRQQLRGDGHEGYRERVRSLYDEDQDGTRDEEAW